MTRVLRTELRRSSAGALFLVLLVAGVGLLYSAPDVWAYGWMPVAMAERQYLILLWPLALAAGAWQSRREQRSNVAELFASTSRPLPQRVAPTLAVMAVAAASGYLVVAATTVPWIAHSARYLPTAVFAVVAVGALSLVAAAWLGMAIGRLVPSPATAPVVAVAGIAVLLILTPPVLGGRTWLAAMLSPTRGIGLFSDFRTVSGRVSAAQALWLAGVAVTGTVLLAAGKRLTRVAALIPLLLGAGAALAVIPQGSAYVDSPIDRVAQQLVCAEGSPRVCVSRAHAGLLDVVTPRAREALRLLARLPDPPTSAVEDVNTFLDEHVQPYRADTVMFRIEIGGDGRLLNPDSFAMRMLYAGGMSEAPCPDGLDPAVSIAVAHWLMGEEPPAAAAEPDADIHSVWAGLHALPEQAAIDRVAAVRKAALACGDLAEALAGGTA
ncbi:hypothetical protein AB0H83_33130 [Dactylosporangium sp. NPDC050688]|uniref:hypothetical protein n=1 Tax=Dactylosporangium sp. NPDC050688 TaxID=3157217 RepID=UPI003406E563